MARNVFDSLDLNLLRTLSILVQERNMRRASERMFVTQPAVSQALKKLRHHFRDELFVKTPTGLEPTSFTLDLMEKVEPLLEDLAEALNEGESFDPAEIHYPLNVALAPHVANFLSTELFRAIRRDSPRAQVRLDVWKDGTIDELVKGEQLLGINASIEQVSNEITRLELADDHYTAYVREDHPQLSRKRSITLKDLDGVEIAALIIPGFNTRENQIERLLKSNGYQSRVGFRSAYPAAVIEVIRSTDMIFGASSFIDHRQLEGLRALDVKINDEFLKSPVTAYFHRTKQNSPLIQWLTGLARELLV